MMPGPALITALDAAYEAFAVYPRPQRIEASPIRDPAKILATLSSAPLRRLTGEQIGLYAGWALTTVGSVTDYKHFLPRILEQATLAPEWLGTEPPVIASKLKMAKWSTWPRSEQSAVIAVFQTAWRESIEQHPDDGADAPEWLCGLAALGEDIQPLLHVWLAHASGNSLLQIAKLTTELPALVSLDPRKQIFWAAVAPEVRAQIVSWLVSPQVGAALEAAEGVVDDDIWCIEQAESALADHARLARH
jgi:hypothetical protein